MRDSLTDAPTDAHDLTTTVAVTVVAVLAVQRARHTVAVRRHRRTDKGHARHATA